MPGATLHVTFIDLLQDAAIPAPFAQAIAAHPRLAHYGAMALDLPYYGNMALMAIRYGLNRPAEFRPWGKRIHDEGGAVPIFARLCARMRDASAVPEAGRLALLAGVASHIALDVAQHDLVRFIARREAARGEGDESFHHRYAEKFHSMFFHLDRFGRDVIGSPEWLELTRLTEGGSLLWRRHDPAVTGLWLGALADHYGDAPTVSQWTDWQRNFIHFGFLTSGFLAARNTRLYSTPENRRIYYSNDLFHFPDHMDAAFRLAERMLTLTAEYLDAGRFDDGARKQFLADLQLPKSLGWPESTTPPHPYEVPPLPARRRQAGRVQ
ncbi:MAG TPA: hypothetical protein VGQ83_11345 [Polyangia bacterium]